LDVIQAADVVEDSEQSLRIIRRFAHRLVHLPAGSQKDAAAIHALSTP